MGWSKKEWNAKQEQEHENGMHQTSKQEIHDLSYLFWISTICYQDANLCKSFFHCWPGATFHIHEIASDLGLDLKTAMDDPAFCEILSETMEHKQASAKQQTKHLAIEDGVASESALSQSDLRNQIPQELEAEKKNNKKNKNRK